MSGIVPRAPLALLIGLFLAASPGALEAQAGSSPDGRLYVQVGVGMPELLHASVGYFVGPRTSVEVTVGNVIFNPLVGVGASMYLGGDSAGLPSHGWVVSGDLRINPTKLRLESYGDVLAAAVTAEAGYRFQASGGLFADSRLGALLYVDNGRPAAGPVFTLGAGHIF